MCVLAGVYICALVRVCYVEGSWRGPVVKARDSFLVVISDVLS